MLKLSTVGFSCFKAVSRQVLIAPVLWERSDRREAAFRRLRRMNAAGFYPGRKGGE